MCREISKEEIYWYPCRSADIEVKVEKSEVAKVRNGVKGYKDLLQRASEKSYAELWRRCIDLPTKAPTSYCRVDSMASTAQVHSRCL